MKISNLKRDSKTVESGSWVGDLPGMGEMRLKVRGLTSRVFLEVQTKKQNSVPISSRKKNGAIETDEAVRIFSESLHEAILLDWDGIEGEDGKPIKYDAALAKSWLSDPDFYHFQEAVHTAATRLDNSKAEVVEAVSKN